MVGVGILSEVEGGLRGLGFMGFGFGGLRFRGFRRSHSDNPGEAYGSRSDE